MYRSGMWDIMADSSASDIIDTSASQTAFPQNNAGVYLPNEEAAAFEDMRCRLERLMQLGD